MVDIYISLPAGVARTSGTAAGSTGVSEVAVASGTAVMACWGSSAAAVKVRAEAAKRARGRKMRIVVCVLTGSCRFVVCGCGVCIVWRVEGWGWICC